MQMNIFFFLFTFAAVSVRSDDGVYKLPKSVLPLHYDLLVNTNLNASSYKGDVSITLKALEGTNKVMLHSQSQTIISINLVGPQNVIPVDSFVQQMDLLEIRFQRSLEVNQTYVLTMEFHGDLRIDGKGFHLASYMDPENITRYLAATHFEPTYSRSAFPCFDEPNLKATFQISLVRATTHSTVSNMNLLGSLPYFGDPNKMIDMYDVSPKMSTYLVAFAVLDFTKISDGMYTIYGREALLGRGDGAYALSVAKGAMEAMTNVTSVDYVISKLDQVAIPSENYSFDAMGNLGMITYRERNLMYNEENVTASETQMVAMTIAREVAHQWFGNLVTPQWWNYVWLSEGLSTYFAVALLDELEPDWVMSQQFTTLVMQPAFEADALNSSKPMTRNVEVPSEIETIFDTISSNKAASIIGMASALLGEKVFKSGIESYLTNWQLDNVEPANLYQSWQETLGDVTVNVSQIFQTWELQAGYPVVTVTRDYESYTTLSQKRFWLKVNATDEGARWIIPLTWFSPNSTPNEILMISSEINLTLNVPAEDWIVVNYNREGFYRVAYDETNWMLLTNALLSNLSQFTVQNRAQFIDDAFNLARAGLLDYRIAFDLGKYIAEEEEYVPIAAFTNALAYLDRITRRTDHNSNIRKYGIEILEKVYQKLGFEFLSTDSHMRKLIRANVLTSLCDLRYNECKTKSVDEFIAWSDYGELLNPDSQAIVLCNALRNGTDSVSWALVFNAYFFSQDERERSRIASTLGCLDYDVMLGTLFTILLVKGLDMNAMDRVIILTSIFSNTEVDGMSVVLSRLSRNFTAADEIIGSMPAVIMNIASRINSEDLLNQLQFFAETNQQFFSESFKEVVSMALSDAEYNIRWLRGAIPQFDSYFPSVTETPGPDDGGVSQVMISIPILIFSSLIALFNY